MQHATNNVHGLLRDVMEEAGMENVTQHLFRRTIAIVVSDAQGALLASELLRRTDPGVTMQHYVQRNETVNPATSEHLDSRVREGRMNAGLVVARVLRDVDLRHHGPMDIDTVKTLPLADQMTFLRGRILEESLSMEAVARYVYVRLSDGSNLEEALNTPQQFKTLAEDCSNFVPSCERLGEETKPLAVSAIGYAAALYERRNRFVHDALRHDLISEERWARFTLWRRKGEKDEHLPSPEPVSSEEMIDLVFDLIRTTWRLRGLLWSLIGTSQEVSPYLTHAFEPQWDGSVKVVNDSTG